MAHKSTNTHPAEADHISEIGCQAKPETRNNSTQTCKLILLPGIFSSAATRAKLKSKGANKKKKKSTTKPADTNDIGKSQKHDTKNQPEKIPISQKNVSVSSQANPNKQDLIDISDKNCSHKLSKTSKVKQTSRSKSIWIEKTLAEGATLPIMDQSQPESGVGATRIHPPRPGCHVSSSAQKSELSRQFGELRLSSEQSKSGHELPTRPEQSDRAYSSSGEDSLANSEMSSDIRPSRTVDADRQSRIIYLTNRDQYERRAELLINAVPFRMPNS